MALRYQKAYKVRDGSLEGSESLYTSKGEEACKDAGGTWYNSKCMLGVESPSSEKYNKLAKAFNDRLTSGAGDPTWRLFFYVHSLTRTMVIPPLDAPQPGILQIPRGSKDDKTTMIDGGSIGNHNEDFWWKLYSHIELFPSEGKDKYKEFGQYIWPTGPFAKPGGANPANPLVSYVLGTGKNGASVENNWHDMRKMPPEWFRLGMIPISLYSLKPEWDPYASEYPLYLFKTVLDDPQHPNASSKFSSANFSRRHRPITLAEKWIMAKLQRGVAGFVSVDGVAATGKLRAEAPAYFAPRIYHKFDFNWRSPHGKYAPSYTPSADILEYCPSTDPRFPPSPNYKYLFKAINPMTHSDLEFKAHCSGAGITKVRRKYDHYELEFGGGYHRELTDYGRKTFFWGAVKKGPLKLSYKHYIEGTYDGGGKLEKREAYHDQIGQISNYFNSGFRNTPEMAKRETWVVPETSTEKPLYSSVGEATFDLPTYNFEFEKFFEKQYSLAPAFGGFQAISTKDGEVPKMTPKYPRFGMMNDSAAIATALSLANSGKLFTWQKDNDGYGQYVNMGYSRLFPVQGFCIAGYYLWGVGIQIKHERTNGETTKTGASFNLKIKKTPKWGGASTTIQDISVSVHPYSDSGLCLESNGTPSAVAANHLSISACLTADGRTFLQDGFFQKMYYFDAGEEIADAGMEVELLNATDLIFLPKTRYGFPNRMLSTTWPSVPQIFFEVAHILQSKPDLYDSLALLRIASTGKGSKIEDVGDEDDVWFGPIENEATTSQVKSRATGLDTRGKDMDFIPNPYTLKGTDSGDDVRKDSKEPFDIWEEYNTFGYIPNIMGALELPDKMAKGYNLDSSYTLANLTANALQGGDPFANSNLPINLNPIYDSARELYGDNLRMIPRNQFVDYRVEEDCPFCSNEYYTTKDSCEAAGYEWGGKFKRDKSVLTFERYVHGASDAGGSTHLGGGLGGLGLELIDKKVIKWTEV